MAGLELIAARHVGHSMWQFSLMFCCSSIWTTSRWQNECPQPRLYYIIKWTVTIVGLPDRLIHHLVADRTQKGMRCILRVIFIVVRCWGPLRNLPIAGRSIWIGSSTLLPLRLRYSRVLRYRTAFLRVPGGSGPLSLAWQLWNLVSIDCLNKMFKIHRAAYSTWLQKVAYRIEN